jgi:CDP-diacylglycerol--serine O-phosphatidyltransferase
MILYQFLKISFASEENGIEINSIFLLPAFFVAAAAAYRLAKFNLIENPSNYFIGVPTPAVGLLVAAFPLIFWYSPFQFINAILTNYWILYVFILIICWLMLSNIKFMSLKMHSLGFKENSHVYILIFLSLLSFLILHWIAVPIIFIAYIILSLIFKKRFL